MDKTEDTGFSLFSSKLREKWQEIPTTRYDRVFSSEMLNWPDDKLLSFWEESRQQTTVPEVRGWYQHLYKDILKGSELADIGPGVGIDGIFFAEHGAKVTFVDIVEDNLKLIQRICQLKSITANFYYIDDFFKFHFENMFDVFMFIGSMHNAPFEFSQRQAQSMLPFLRKEGKIIMLAYPKERYDQMGAKDFVEFGQKTDGERTPWCEWYNDEKIKSLFGSDFRLNWSRNFGADNIEFNWFDLTRMNYKPSSPVHHLPKESFIRKSTFEPTGEWENARGDYLLNKGDIKGAYSAFVKAIEINPTTSNVYKNLASWTQYNTSIEKIEKVKNDLSDYFKTPPTDRDISSLFNNIKIPLYFNLKSEKIGLKKIPLIDVNKLHTQLKFKTPIDYPSTSLHKPLTQWKMEIDDSPIFRYIYRNVKPRRHLEFGTWRGTGTMYCLEECDATVWTVNIPFGEENIDGMPTYTHFPEEKASVHAWANKIGFPDKEKYRTDSFGFIGMHYLEKELGNRVCQIYADSTKWDTSHYPEEFFDTILIDGGHSKDIVISDTKKALPLLKRGGIIMWHDFCPPVYEQFEVTRDVMEGITHEWKWLKSQMRQLFWIYPSWILLGVKKFKIRK
jgi:predicted O-methyltransferase YrrM